MNLIGQAASYLSALRIRLRLCVAIFPLNVLAELLRRFLFTFVYLALLLFIFLFI